MAGGWVALRSGRAVWLMVIGICVALASPISAITITWGGAISTNWHLPANWFPQQVPTSADDVIIQYQGAELPIISDDAEAKSIVIEGGAELSISDLCVVEDNVTVDVGAGLHLTNGFPGDDANLQADNVFVQGTFSGSPFSGLAPILQVASKLQLQNGSTSFIHALTFSSSDNTIAYAMEFQSGATINNFNNVTISAAASTTAAVLLHNVTTSLTSFASFAVSGSSPANIDATSFLGSVITINPNINDAGALYGEDLDIDPNNKLTWVPFATATTWTGAVNTAWENAGNWTDGVPVSGRDATIQAATNQPMINATAACKSLTIDASASVAISGSQSLTIVNDFLNNGSFTAGSGSITIGGDWTNNNSFSAGSSLVTLNSATAVQLGGSAATTFWDLSIFKSGGSVENIGVAWNVNDDFLVAGGAIKINDISGDDFSVSGTMLASNATTFELAAGTTLTLNTPTQTASIGSLVSNGSGVSRPVISGSFVQLQLRGVTDIDGCVFDLSGTSASSYGLEFSFTDSSIAQFDNVSILSAASGIAAIILLPPNSVSTYNSLEISGSSPANISATSYSGPVITVTPGPNNGGTLYGEHLDIDPNNKIIWETIGPTTWTGAVDTRWENGDNWSNGVPDSDADATIPNVTNDPVIDGTTGAATAKSVTINSGGSLTMSGTPTLYVYGSLLNSGTFTAGNGTVEFRGPDAATVSLASPPTTYYNLTINKDVGSIATTETIFGYTINNHLTVQSGTLDLDVPFLLQVAGDVTVESAGTLSSSASTFSLWLTGSLTNDGVISVNDWGLRLRGSTSTALTSATPLSFEYFSVEKDNSTSSVLCNVPTLTSTLTFIVFDGILVVEDAGVANELVLTGSTTRIYAGETLELGDDVGVQLSPSTFLNVEGTLRTASGAASKPVLRGPSPNIQVKFGGHADLDGLIIDNVGTSSSNCIHFLSGSFVDKFDNVTFTNSPASSAIVRLQTSNRPAAFNGLGFSTAITPRNIDATGAGSSPIVTISPDAVDAGNRYGAQYETDPLNILTWNGTQIDVREDDAAGAVIVNGASAEGNRDFGAQPVSVGPTLFSTIFVKNIGSGTLTLGTPAVTAGDTGDFVIDTDDQYSFTPNLGPGESTEFGVAFDPTDIGSRLATVTFTHNALDDSSPYAFDVTGIGQTDQSVTEQDVPTREGGSVQEPVRNGTIGANSVYLHNGEFRYDLPLMSLPGRALPLGLSLTYRSHLDFDGPVGHGWTGSFLRRITYDSSSDSITHFTGSGRIDTFTLQGGGTSGVGPYIKAGYFVEIMRDDNGTSGDESDDTFEILGANGSTSTFAATIEDSNGDMMFREVSVEDRYGNENTCIYNVRGQLTEMRGDLYSAGTPNRYRLLLTYDSNDRLQKVTDYADYTIGIGVIGGPTGNREWEFVYDAAGDLTEIKLPKTARYFSETKGSTYRTRVSFTYDASHNMIEAIDARESNKTTPIGWLKNHYDGSGRVFMQDLGRTTAGDITHREHIVYTSATNVNCVDQGAHREEYILNANGTASAVKLYTATWNPADLSAPIGPKIRPSDPDFYETLFEYDSQLQLTKVTYPLGNSMSYRHDITNSSQRSKGNLLRILATPDVARSGSLPADQVNGLLTTMTYTDTANFNLLQTIVNPRAYSVPVGFDIVTSPDPTPNDAALFTTTFTYFPDGSLQKTTSPTVDATISPDSLNVGQFIESFYTYTSFGQLLTATDQAGVRTRYEYGTSGFMKDYVSEILVGDQTGAPLSTLLDYNSVGQVTNVVDPEGFLYANYINQLDQSVRSETPPVTFHGNVKYFTEFLYDLNGNLETLKVSNFDENGALQTPNTIDSTYQYNILDLVTSVTEPVDIGQNRSMSYVYDVLYRMTEAVMPEGNRSATDYDELNRSIKSFYGYGFSVPKSNALVTGEVFYDLNSNVERALDGRGNDSHFFFDGYDRTIEVQDRLASNPNKTLFEYNRASQVTVATRIGKKQAFVSNNFVIQNNKTLAQSKTFYDNLGRPYMGHVLAQKPNETDLGYPANEVNADDDILTGFAVSRVKFRINGQVAETRDDLNYAHRYSYDVYNRLSAIEDDRDGPGGNNDIDRYFYDDNSNVTAIEANLVDDTDESVTTLVTSFQYDSINRLVQDISPYVNAEGDSLYRSFRYDSRSNLVKTIDRKGVTRSYQYDLLDRGIRSTIHDVDILDVDTGSKTTFSTTEDIVSSAEFDLNSNLLASIDPNGNRTQFKYDLAERWLQTVLPDGLNDGVVGGHKRSAGVGHALSNVSGSVFFSKPGAYDGNSNPLAATDSNGTVVFNTFDANDNLTDQISDTSGTDPQFEIIGEKGLGYDYDGLYRSIMGRTFDPAFTELTRTETLYDTLSNPHRQRQSVALPQDCYNGGVVKKDLVNQFDESGRRWQKINPSGKSRVTWLFDRKHRPTQMQVCFPAIQQIQPRQLTQPSGGGGSGGGSLGGGGTLGGGSTTGGGTVSPGGVVIEPIAKWTCKGTIMEFDYLGGGLLHRRHVTTMLGDPTHKVISDFYRDELLRVTGVRHVRDEDGNKVPSAPDTLFSAFSYGYDQNSMMTHERRWYQDDGGGFNTPSEEADYYIHDDRNQLVKAIYNILDFDTTPFNDLDTNNVVHTDRQVFARRKVPTRKNVAWYRHEEGYSSSPKPDSSNAASQVTGYDTSDYPGADPDNPAPAGEGSRHTYDVVGSYQLRYDFNKNVISDATREFRYNYMNQLRTVERRSDNATIAEYREDAYARRVMAEIEWELGRRLYFDTRFELDVLVDADFDEFNGPYTPMALENGFMTSFRHESSPQVPGMPGVNDETIELDLASWPSHLMRVGANDEHYIDTLVYMPGDSGETGVYYGYIAYSDDVAVHIWDDRIELGNKAGTVTHGTHFINTIGGLYDIGIKVTASMVRVYLNENQGGSGNTIITWFPGSDKRQLNGTLSFGTKGIRDSGNTVYAGMFMMEQLTYLKAWNRSNGAVPVGCPRVQVSFFDGPVPASHMEAKPGTVPPDLFAQPTADYLDAQDSYALINDGAGHLDGTLCLPDGKRCTGAVIDENADLVCVGKTDAMGDTRWFTGDEIQFFDPFTGKGDFTAPPIPELGYSFPTASMEYFPNQFGGAVAPIDPSYRDETISSMGVGMDYSSASNFALTDDGLCACRGGDPSDATMTVAYDDSAIGLKQDFRARYYDPRGDIMFSNEGPKTGKGSPESDDNSKKIKHKDQVRRLLAKLYKKIPDSVLEAMKARDPSQEGTCLGEYRRWGRVKSPYSDPDEDYDPSDYRESGLPPQIVYERLMEDLAYYQALIDAFESEATGEFTDEAKLETLMWLISKVAAIQSEIQTFWMERFIAIWVIGAILPGADATSVGEGCADVGVYLAVAFLTAGIANSVRMAKAYAAATAKITAALAKIGKALTIGAKAFSKALTTLFRGKPALSFEDVMGFFFSHLKRGNGVFVKEVFDYLGTSEEGRKVLKGLLDKIQETMKKTPVDGEIMNPLGQMVEWINDILQRAAMK